MEKNRMEFSFYFPPANLKACVSEIAERHLCEMDVINGALTEKAEQLVRRLAAMRSKKLPKFALALEGDWLEAALTALQIGTNEALSQKLVEIIRLKPKERLFDLCWQMLQDDCDNRGLINAMEVLCDYLKSKHGDIYSQSLPAQLGGRCGMLGRYALRILQEEGNIKGFFERYAIKASSALGLELQSKFFSLCDARGFIDNKEMLPAFIDSGKNSWVRMVVANYLGMLDVVSYFDDFNLLLIERFGSPEDAESWVWLDIHLIEKLKRWQMLYRIRSYYNHDPVVTHMWTRVHEKLTKVEGPDDAGVLTVSLQNSVILCGFPELMDGWLYSKALYQRRFGKKDGDIELNWAQLLPREAPAARDAIIAGVRSEVYRLDFTGAGILFAGELLIEIEGRGLVTHR